jgi:hypothetical protein
MECTFVAGWVKIGELVELWFGETQTAFLFLFLSNQQSEYSVFHELMCWQSLTFRLSNVMSPL